MNHAERAFAWHRSGPVAEAWLTNLLDAPDMPYALGARHVSRSGTCVCVGAGPSLSRTGPELRRMQEAGALICTVNTALPAVSRYCVPDVVLAREVVDVSSHLAHPAGLRVLDLGASPEAWDVARVMGPTAWFIAGSTNTFELAATIGVRPLFGGPSALTAMVALCEEWGAAEIVLVGCDLAFASDGSVYADGSAFSGQRATFDANGVATNAGDGFAAKLAQHAAGGVEPYPTQETTLEIDGYDGPVRTIAQWAEQIEWLATFAHRRADIVCVDATGSGAKKPGWRAAEMLSLDIVRSFDRHGYAMSPWPSRPRYAALDAEAVRTSVRVHLTRQVDVAEEVAVNALHPDGDPACVDGLLEGFDVVDMLAARSLLAGAESSAPTIVRIRHAYGKSYPLACARLRELMP